MGNVFLTFLQVVQCIIIATCVYCMQDLFLIETKTN